MAEEFQESEIIFQEHGGDEDQSHYHFTGHSKTQESRTNNNKLKRKKNNNKKKKSVPVDIPENVSGDSWFQYVDSDFFDDEFDDDGEITPPHVILGRRIARKMAFSVYIGNGRTLKGRDLREVRNSILRMTGFLET